MNTASDLRSSGLVDEGGGLPSTKVSAYGYEFNPYSEYWILSKDIRVNLTWLKNASAKMTRSIRVLLTLFATQESPSHAKNMAERLSDLLDWHHLKRGELNEISWETLASYRNDLNHSSEWYLSSIAGLIKKWHSLGLDGVSDSAVDYLDGTRLKGNIKGEAVKNSDPKKGPLSDFELSSLINKANDALVKGKLPIDDYCLLFICIVTARRPRQLSDLKIKDFDVTNNSDGSRSYVLTVPRAKQRGGSWRSSFSKAMLEENIGLAVEAHIEQIKQKLKRLHPNIKNEVLENYPIFINWKNDGYNEQARKQKMRVDLDDHMHFSAPQIGQKIRAIVSLLEVPSDRVEKLEASATRFRRTLGTRAAKEGNTEVTIAELLDHSDTQNVRVYTENVPEHVDAINRAMAEELAPIAQAFIGVVVNNEKEARRGDDQTSRIKIEQDKNAGNCGKYGFCSSSAPTACYTCRYFQPWIDAPHQELLDTLLEKAAKLKEKGVSDQVISSSRQTIIAVQQVIDICEEAKGAKTDE